MVNLNTTIRNLTKILCGTYLSCDEKEDQKYVGFKGETSVIRWDRDARN